MAISAGARPGGDSDTTCGAIATGASLRTTLGTASFLGFALAAGTGTGRSAGAGGASTGAGGVSGTGGASAGGVVILGASTSAGGGAVVCSCGPDCRGSMGRGGAGGGAGLGGGSMTRRTSIASGSGGGCQRQSTTNRARTIACPSSVAMSVQRRGAPVLPSPAASRWFARSAADKAATAALSLLDRIVAPVRAPPKRQIWGGHGAWFNGR